MKGLNNKTIRKLGIADNLVHRSSRAVCGAFEREVVVKPENINKSVRALKQSGYQVVGRGERKDRIWFIKRGLAGL